MPLRRAGAPRLIDWTGERCVPWMPDIQVLYEHYHRYLWARSLVAGRRVLDLGSGEGFGAALIARGAQSVLGIDIDERAVKHAELNYASDSLSFAFGSAQALGEVAGGSFDVVVAFEVIEHIAEQEEVLAEVKRVLTPDGMLILSTPDRAAYREAREEPNPFHERELDQSELRTLLGGFANVELLGQHAMAGSRIEALVGGQQGPSLDVAIERSGDSWEEAASPRPLYLIAVASDGELPEPPRGSTLADYAIEIRHELSGELARAKSEVDAGREDVERARGEVARLVDVLASEREQARKQDAELQLARQELARFNASIFWRAFQRMRRKVYSLLGGADSLPGRALRKGTALLARIGSRQVERRRWRALRVPSFPSPDVSIVIPVHSNAVLTERCLRAIVASSGSVAYEVIVVDDVADRETKALLGAVEGLRLIVNESNLGFLHSTNRGAASARGRHIVLLNNDTEPQPGWLDALVDRAEARDDIGIVTAKLVYPDGALQEAGGIVWRGGVPWNYGNGMEAHQPEYNYVREVDYGSAAALLVRSELWEAAGGFDERYAPGYFEDADLCFTARSLGWRVLYEPRAVVLHHEGGTMGTDTSVGGKRHQELNQPKFAEKWRAELEKQPADPSWENAHLASSRTRGPFVLVVDHRIPSPDRDSGSLRMWSILEALLELGCRVVFLPDDHQPVEPYSTRLRGIGVEVLDGPVVVPERIAAMGEHLALAILSRPYVAARYIHVVREHAPKALLAYDTVDLHYLREQRRRENGGGSPRVAEGFRELELALARAADVTLAVSGDEAEQLVRDEPAVSAEVLPNANPVTPDPPGPEQRAGLLFVGGFEHPPNVDAVEYLVNDVMSHVWRELPDATLTIVGGNAPEAVTTLAGPRVEVAGWVQDLEALLREKLAVVAPMRYGAGMKGKVTQALAAGMPVVTTAIGAEGLDATDGREMLLAEDSEGLAERIVRLHHEADLWHQLSAAGQALADRVCSPRLQRDVLGSLIERRAVVPSAEAEPISRR
jgi:GT2 family glycosyltransferase/SAM-dependent methyltransferase/glycosyltransferase involved in cell wall biosynthesis